MKRVVTVVGVMGLLAGCASGQAQSPWLTGKADATPMTCAPLSQDQELALNLAQKTAEEGRLHGALANLERLPANLPQARLAKARILRSLNRPEAGDLYASLTRTCLKAQGEQGLGQLASAAGRYPEALEHLRLAAALDPTSAPIRNDLGVVYMNLGRMDEARFELLTALELNESEQQPALNLLTLLIYQGKRPQADALAKRMGFSASQMRAAEERAEAMRSKSAGLPTPTAAAAPAAKAPVIRVIPQDAPALASATPVIPVPAKAEPVTKPVVPVVQPAVSAAPPAVPAPRLSNFRPAPVVPLSLAGVSARSAAPAPAVVAKAEPAANTPPAPSARIAAASVAAQPAIARAPAPVVTPPPAVAPQPAPAVSATPPVVAAAPKALTPPATPAPVVAAPVVASAPAPARTPAPAAATPSSSRFGIEMRAGRLIVPDDGGFVRVVPIEETSASVN